MRIACLADPETAGHPRDRQSPRRWAGLLIEVTLDTDELRTAMIDYGLRILLLSAVISLITAILAVPCGASACWSNRSNAWWAICNPMPPPPKMRAG